MILTNEQHKILMQAREELCKLIELGPSRFNPATEEFQQVFDLVGEIEEILGW